MPRTPLDVNSNLTEDLSILEETEKSLSKPQKISQEKSLERMTELVMKDSSKVIMENSFKSRDSLLTSINSSYEKTAERILSSILRTKTLDSAVIFFCPEGREDDSKVNLGMVVCGAIENYFGSSIKDEDSYTRFRDWAINQPVYYQKNSSIPIVTKFRNREYNEEVDDPKKKRELSYSKHREKEELAHRRLRRQVTGDPFQEFLEIYPDEEKRPGRTELSRIYPGLYKRLLMAGQIKEIPRKKYTRK